MTDPQAGATGATSLDDDTGAPGTDPGATDPTGGDPSGTELSGTEPGDAVGAAGGRPANRRSWLTATTVGLLVVFAVVASAVGVLAFTTDDGAVTPEDATRAMLDAVRRNDLVGMVQQLPPGERKPLRDSVARLAGQLQRLRLIGVTDPSRVNGPVLTFEGIELRTVELAKQVKAVDLVGGSFTAAWPGGGPPLTDEARKALDRELGVTVDPSESAYRRDFAQENLRLVTVKEGGGWHVSLAYSAAEALRARSGRPSQDLGRGPGTFGADSPDGAVKDLVGAYAEADPERMISLVFPDEGRALYDFAPHFLAETRAAALAAGEKGIYDVQLNKLDLAVSGTGDTRQVHITALDLDLRDELHKQHLWWQDGCLHADQRVNDDDEPYAKTDTCSKDRPRAGDVTAPRDNPVASLAIFGGGADLPTFTVVERNGRWYVSPVHTLVDSLIATLERLQPGDDVAGYAARLGDSWQGGAGAGLVGEPIRPTAAEAAADPAAAQARGRALANACAALAPGAGGDAVTTSCLKRLVARGRISVAALPEDARARLG